MNILDISPLLPYPPDYGGSRAVLGQIRSNCARGHHVHLFCLTEREDADAVRELGKFCTVETFLYRRDPTLHGAIASLNRTIPYQLSRFHHPGMLTSLRNALRAGHYDIVQAEGIHAAYYALPLEQEFDVPVVMRVHNLQFLQMSRTIPHVRNPLMKLWLAYETPRVRAYERECYPRFTSNLTVSEVERVTLLSLAPSARCEVVPPGIDTEEFAPRGAPEDPCTVLWTGALGHRPNVDSFWWFYREIVPLIVRRFPGVRIKIVGGGVPADILKLRLRNVEIAGFVPDIRGELDNATVCVVPLRSGSGVRMKLLEMFAMGKAIVSTALGVEGLPVRDGEHILLADTPGDFARRVSTLLADRALRDRLGRAARSYVCRGHSWDHVGLLYESAYAALLERRHPERKPVAFTSQS